MQFRKPHFILAVWPYYWSREATGRLPMWGRPIELYKLNAVDSLQSKRSSAVSMSKYM